MNVPASSTYTLHDGRVVSIRPVQPDDGPRLQALVRRLSPESRFFRFMEYLKELSAAQAAVFTNLDYHQRMALAAVIEQGGEEQVIAVARYALQPGGEPGRAEVGVVVEDAYQSLGLGTHLLAQLTIYARQHGIHTFIASIYPTNERILKFIQQSGLKFKRRFVEGAWEVSILLTPPSSLSNQ
jgi:acetyltransferase